MILQILSEKKETPYDFVSWNNGNNKTSRHFFFKGLSGFWKGVLCRLAEQIEQGMYGIENMDYKYLAEDLIENEPELFS